MSTGHPKTKGLSWELAADLRNMKNQGRKGETLFPIFDSPDSSDEA